MAASTSQADQQQVATTQWAYRAQKSIGLNTGAPTYSAVSGFDQVDGPARVFQYSSDGSMFAAALENSTRVVDTRETTTCAVKHDLAISKVVDLEFSPNGSYLSTWERPSKLEDGVTNAKNLNIWDTESGKQVASFERKAQGGCFCQFTANEAYCVRQVTNELQVYDAKKFDQGVIGRLRLEGMTSFEIGPGDKPSIAVFCGEKKGQPASVRIFTLASLVPSPETPPAPVSQKTFFKADKIQIKWNQNGTCLLLMTSTDHDKTGKSYYGETNLYLMSVRGDFDCRVGLDKEGPIHDFEWNPNSKEFIVLYGYMPAKAVLFSHRVNVIAELGTQPRNFVSFNPQGRLFCIAGFGNLSGTVDIWDRENLAKGKILSMDASNSSVCQWSPDGHFLLTATLSPRLRVENGVKVWHCSGDLIHVDMIDELYQASWRPTSNSAPVSFPKEMPKAPSPSPAATAYLASKSATKKPAGAYRPPGARGQNTPDIYKREDENGSSTPSRSGSQPNGTYQAGGSGNRRRGIPGAAAPPGSSSTRTNHHHHNGGGGAAAGGKKKGNAKNGATPPSTAATHTEPTDAVPAVLSPVVAGPTDVGGSTSAAGTEKKIRNLTKKLKAIEDLKMRQAHGEKLEITQLAKIQAEAEIRKDLAQLE